MKREILDVKNLCEIVCKGLVIDDGIEKNCIVKVLKEINIKYKKVKKIECYGNNEIVKVKVDYG